MATLPDPTKSKNPEVKKLLASLMKKRGRVDGMYRTLLNHPALAKHIGELGSFLRFEGKLPGDVREVLILFVARAQNAAYEWTHHITPARDNGVSAAIIEKIRTRKPLPPSSPYSPVLKAAQFVLKEKPLPAPLQKKLVEKYGVEGVIEIVTLTGFYSLIGDIIRSFDVPLPPRYEKALLKPDTLY